MGVAAMSEVVDLKPAFRSLCVKLREFRPMMSFSVGHLGFDVVMLESGRTGALQFVVLFSPHDRAVQGSDVRVVFSSVRDDEVAIAIRGGGGGTSLGAYKLSGLMGSALRDLIDSAVADAVARVEVLGVNRDRSQDWQQQPA
jgi:hypothetical protein